MNVAIKMKQFPLSKWPYINCFLSAPIFISRPLRSSKWWMAANTIKARIVDGFDGVFSIQWPNEIFLGRKTLRITLVQSASAKSNSFTEKVTQWIRLPSMVEHCVRISCVPLIIAAYLSLWFTSDCVKLQQYRKIGIISFAVSRLLSTPAWIHATHYAKFNADFTFNARIQQKNAQQWHPLRNVDLSPRARIMEQHIFQEHCFFMTNHFILAAWWSICCLWGMLKKGFTSNTIINTKQRMFLARSWKRC